MIETSGRFSMMQDIMSIKKLPEYLINKIKAGEIVERPASVVKELLENALDAGATKISIDIVEGGKNLIKIEDNGHGIDVKDIELVLERYATSKIEKEDDLYTIASYGFRGEALASISEVSKLTIQTKTEDASIGLQLSKVNDEIHLKHITTYFTHGTVVLIEDLFYNTPARLKFLKSTQTEYVYIYQLFIEFALIHRDKQLVFKKNGTTIFSLQPKVLFKDRVTDIYKKEIEKNLREVSFEDPDIKIHGVVGDTTLSYPAPEQIKLFVNQRPVQDKILKKAILSAYERQLAAGQYPLAMIFIDIKPALVDVNVHPRKLEVKFLDPGSIFNIVKTVIFKALGNEKVMSVDFPKSTSSFTSYQSVPHQQGFDFSHSVQPQITTPQSLWQSSEQQDGLDEMIQQYYQLVGQIWDRYIVLQSVDGVYMIDQHALAERIAFEKLKKERKSEGVQQEILLQPLVLTVSKDVALDGPLQGLQSLGFDIAQFGEEKIILHAVPKPLITYDVDLEKVLDQLWYSSEMTLDHVLDQILATKACKASIKAGQKLSFPEMHHLVKQGFEHIDGMFVCQHGRPFFVKLDRHEIDKMFDR